MDKKPPAGGGTLPPCSAQLLSKQRWRPSIVLKFQLEAIRDSASPKLQRYWELPPKVLFTSLRLACLLHSG